MKRIMLIFLSVILFCAFSRAEDASADLPVLEIEPELIQMDAGTGENLAEGYIRQKLYPRKTGLFKAPRLSGNSLTGADRVLYEYLKTKAAAVAAGTDNCTITEIPAGEVYEKLTYTAEELGVSVIVSDGAFTPEATAAIRRILQNRFHLSAVFHCLMADCPYEMYWYDKTVGGLLRYPTVVPDGEGVLIRGNVTVYSPVSAEYRDTEYEPVRDRYCYIDTSWGQAVEQALVNARAIADAYEELEDYDRLNAYKEEIQALTEYNDEAAGADYGNPWQLVWVFDGDPDTKVVCEGFAKAFQYLNDLSASSVTVISVTGDMFMGSAESTEHMWNIVRMDDGENYLADITNCFTDGTGNGFLFLDGYLESDGKGRYTYQWGEITITYAYDENNDAFSADDLELSEVGYLTSRPAAPVCAASSETGYTGYVLVIRMDEEADSVRIRETGEEIVCGGTDVLIPLTEAGTAQYTLAAVEDGVRGYYGETLSCTVYSLGEGVLSLPGQAKTVQEEAFAGTAASVIVLPETVETIGAKAFAGSGALQVVELEGDESVADDVFLDCVHPVFCVSEYDGWFEKGFDFLTKQE